MARFSIRERGFFEPPEWLYLPDELDLRDGVFIPNASAGATPGTVSKQAGVPRAFRYVRSDD